MTESSSEQEAFSEGFVGIRRKELEAMPDAELAQWQAGWKSGTEKHILAEKEWARRLAMRQLREQFKLEEKVARVNRWWGVGASLIGVVGALAGVWLGAIMASQSGSPNVSKNSVAPTAKPAQESTPAVAASAAIKPVKPANGS